MLQQSMVAKFNRMYAPGDKVMWRESADSDYHSYTVKDKAELICGVGVFTSKQRNGNMSVDELFIDYSAQPNAAKQLKLIA
jgi:hypothetical protein